MGGASIGATSEKGLVLDGDLVMVMVIERAFFTWSICTLARVLRLPRTTPGFGSCAKDSTTVGSCPDCRNEIVRLYSGGQLQRASTFIRSSEKDAAVVLSILAPSPL